MNLFGCWIVDQTDEQNFVILFVLNRYYKWTIDIHIYIFIKILSNSFHRDICDSGSFCTVFINFQVCILIDIVDYLFRHLGIFYFSHK